jgi:hypothetical protein
LTISVILKDENLSAEEEGFEPPEALTPQRFSRPPQSTTLPFLRCKIRKKQFTAYKILAASIFSSDIANNQLVETPLTYMQLPISFYLLTN